MTHYPTCNGCAVDRATCSIRAGFRERLKGMGATTVKHTCQARRPLLEPGMAVLVRAVTEVLMEPELDVFPGTFIQEIKNRSQYICFVRAETKGKGGSTFSPRNGTGFIKSSLRNITPRPDEPRVDITACKTCAHIPALEGCHGGDLTKLSCPHVQRTPFLHGWLVLAGDEWINPETATDRLDYPF